MRVGKRATVVEAKKTRSCVVRLEKVAPSPSPSPPTRSTRANISSTSMSNRSAGPPESASTSQKTLRGPLKKRPISEAATLSHSTPIAVARAKDAKLKKLDRVAIEEMLLETPPTIAAGRSRRAIKPNPKYTSEDMVTPKLMKSGVLGTGGDKRTGGGSDKQRSNSASSSDDFYNKASSDEENLGSTMHSGAADDDDDDTMDKAYKGDKQSESDYSDIEQEVVRAAPKRGRGRPRKDESAAGHDSATKVPATKAAPPSQLQQLRKSLAVSVNRGLQLTPAGAKRKLETSAADSDNSGPVTQKRFKLPGVGIKFTPVTNKAGVNAATPKTPLGQRTPGQTLNGGKVIQLAASVAMQEKRRILTERLAKLNAKTLSTPPLLLNRPAAPGRTNLLNAAATGKRSASPAPARPAIRVCEALPQKPSTTTRVEKGEDADGMPTFTIVNINDIINKKGDVLISKAAGAKSTATGGGDGPKAETGAEANATPDGRLNRRKAGHTTILSEKLDPEQAKQPLPRTPFPPKRPIQTAPVNRTLLTKPTAATVAKRPIIASTPIEKPAPRILNAMVAKKVQPVKPLIANLDDSTDDSLPLSHDDDDDDDEEEAEQNAIAAAAAADKAKQEQKQQPINAVGRRRLVATIPPYAGGAKTTPTVAATKENSLAATNRLPTQPAGKGASGSPQSEKVTVSQQGDKIVKKITCMENWYVLKIPKGEGGGGVQSRVVRNQLDMPLIQLANGAKSIKLPSDAWSSKVTLYEYKSAGNNATTMLNQGSISKGSPPLYTGDLREQSIKEADRAKYQPSCVMFRRAVSERSKSRLPYDRAVIFKNRTFFTNIEGKNVRLEASPNTIGAASEVEILLEIIDGLTLESTLVEPATTMP